jgi:hypothetical protein
MVGLRLVNDDKWRVIDMASNGEGLANGLLFAGLAKRQAEQNGQRIINEVAAERDDAINNHNQYVFRAKSQIHGFRAALAARKLAEDRLIAALKAENANHPLVSREAVEAIVQENVPKVLLDPEVIKKTYPDGVLPEGAVIPPGLVQNVA